MNYREREKIAKNFVKWMFEEMPSSKKKSFNAAATRNLYLTSEYTLRNVRFTVYTEGWYIEMEGCRSRFACYAADNDGEFVFTRKPNANKLHKLWGIEFDNLFIFPTNDLETVYIDENRVNW